LQTREGCAYWGENKRVAAIILQKREGCTDYGERICLDVFGSDTKLKHKL